MHKMPNNGLKLKEKAEIFANFFFFKQGYQLKQDSPVI